MRQREEQFFRFAYSWLAARGGHVRESLSERKKKVTRYTHTDGRGVSVRLPRVVHIDLRSTVDFAHTLPGLWIPSRTSEVQRLSEPWSTGTRTFHPERTVRRNEANQISNHWPATWLTMGNSQNLRETRAPLVRVVHRSASKLACRLASKRIETVVRARTSCQR